MHISRQTIIVGVAGLFVGAAAILGVRYATYKPDTVHYHANFAVFINGQQEKFEGFRYYEETSAPCTMEKVEDPAERAHMHDNVYNVVHVEDHLVTWGNFFQNLKWGLGDDYLKSIDTVYVADSGHKLSFMLNGKKVDTIANTIIGDQDKLLISYGTGGDGELQQQYATIQNNALKYDTERDPAGCSGNHVTTMTERMRHMF